MTEAPLCALTEDVGLLYVSLALSCMQCAIYLAPKVLVRRFQYRLQIWSPTLTGRFDPKPWHPPVGGSAVVASPLLDGSRLPAQIVSAVLYPAGCSSAASPSLLVNVVLRVLPDIPCRVSSFHTDCAGNPLQPTSTGNRAKLPVLYPCSLPLGLHI